jgi:hypothetical protein
MAANFTVLLVEKIALQQFPICHGKSHMNQGLSIIMIILEPTSTKGWVVLLH